MALEFDRKAFLDAYFGYLATHDDALFWALEVFYSGWDRCDEKLGLVLALVDTAPDDRSLTYVACGPLEDLLLNCGDAVIDRIEDVAQINPRMSRALVHVWGLERNPGIEARVNGILASQNLPGLVRRRVMMLAGARLPDPVQETILSFPRDVSAVHRVALVIKDGDLIEPVLVAWGDDVVTALRSEPTALDITDDVAFHPSEVVHAIDRSRVAET